VEEIENLVSGKQMSVAFSSVDPFYVTYCLSSDEEQKGRAIVDLIPNLALE
jgi:hypothetical protein